MSWVRRIVLAFLVALVVAGLLGLLGPRSRTVSAASGGYHLEVEYPQVARGGLPVDWRVRVARPGGFTEPVTVAITEDYLDLVDVGVVFPEPASQTSQPPYVDLTFDPPPVGVLDVSFAASGEASLHDVGVHDARTLVVVGGTPVVAVGYRTWVVP